MSSKPIHRIAEGRVSAAIWRNSSESNGEYYSVQFSRNYKDRNDDWQSTNSLSQSDLSALSWLAHKADNWISSHVQSKEVHNE